MEMEKKRCSEYNCPSAEKDNRSLSLSLSLLLHKQGGGCLIQKILVWLPVVSLLRFKSVCKSWCDLIQSPFFIHLHTTAITTLNSPSSSSSSKFGSFIVHVKFGFPPNSSSNNQSEKEDALLMLSSPSDDDDSESEEESVSTISGGGSNDDDHEEEEEEGLVVVVDNLGFEMHNKEIVGSCNGLVCIRDRQMARHSSIKPKPIKVYLWNPATGKGVDLPESIPIRGAVFSLFLFGFDVETKDYKVVRFTGLKPRWNGNEPQFYFCQVQVYSLSTNSWRLLEGISCLPGYPFRYPQSVVYLNNNGSTSTCFFLAHFFYSRSHPCLSRNDRLIISFDFTKEILTPIQLPDHHRDQELFLCSLGHDKIALFTSTKPPYEVRIRRYQDFNIWVLNYEQGGSSSSLNKESWKELHSFQLPHEHPNPWMGYTPRGISNDGKFAIFEYGNKMNLYNFATKEVKRDFFSCRKVMSKCYPYKPSLVSLIGGNGAGEMVQGAAAADMVIENSATNL